MSAVVKAATGGGAAASAATVYSAETTLTQAQVNAGAAIIAAETGVAIVVVGMFIRFVGTWTDTDSNTFNLKDSGGSTFVAAISDASSSVMYSEHNTDLTLGAGFCAALTAGLGVSVTTTGTGFTGGGTLLIRLLYRKIAS